MLTPIYLDMSDITIKGLGKKIKIFKILCTKYMASSEAMTSSTHSFAYSYGLVKKCFLKICETLKFHNFLIFQPISIRFSLFCSENFTLSSEIKLDQLRTSPLSFFLHLSATSCKWGLHVSLLSKITPKYLYWVAFSSSFSPRDSLK